MPRNLFKTAWHVITFYPRFEISYTNVSGIGLLSLGYLRIINRKKLEQKQKELEN